MVDISESATVIWPDMTVMFSRMSRMAGTIDFVVDDILSTIFVMSVTSSSTASMVWEVVALMDMTVWDR